MVELLVLGIAILVGAACGDEPAEATSILVTFETPSGSFIARIVDPVSIDRAREAFEEGGSAGIPNGRMLEATVGSTPATTGISRTSSWWI